MNKKSISATILILFLAIFFSVVGVCFSTFVYEKTKTIVEAVNLIVDQGINIYKDQGLTKHLSKLSLSKMELGLKPVTGEIDAETQIPSTIDDQGTSEGYYATIYVDTDSDFDIFITNVDIVSDHNELLIEEEKKNIFVAIKDVKNSVKTLENNNTKIASYSEVSSVQKITFLIWLGSMASDELEGAKINFDLSFVIND